ncbi:hypothetical protein A20C1_08904 [marine actinobacterium PHSC20C1]|nr:hypothetical protein A20C1_08904 [marine actinobacterium PHSC20C1]
MIEITDFDPPRPYAACSQLGNLIFVSGETGVDPTTGEIPADIEAQAEQALRNIETTLRRVGSDLNHLLRLTVYLTDISDLKAVSRTRQRVLPRSIPSATVGVTAFAQPEMKVEIEATAALPG